jgi:oligoendopeptidase F
MGVEITDSKFWERGLQEVDALLAEAEKLAKRIG